MNPYLIVGLMAAWVASMGAAGFYGMDYGESRQIAHEKKLDDYVAAATDAAQQAAAQAIAKIRPVNTTIRQETQHEVQTKTVYRDCRLTPDGLRLANQALTGSAAEPAGGGKLPAADAPRR